MKSKTAFILGGIFCLLAQVGTFVLKLVYFIQLPFMDIISLVNLICVFASLIFTVCCIILTLTTANPKSSYAIIIPTVIVNLFLSFNSFYANLEFLIWFIFKLFLLIGVIFYILGICSSFQQNPKQKENKEELEQPAQQNAQQDDFQQELQKLFAMKNDGLITDEEFDKLKLNLISKELK